MKKILLLTFALLSTFASLLADWEYEYVGETSADIKNIFVADDEVYFSSSNYLYKWNKEEDSWIQITDSLFNKVTIGAIVGYDETKLVSTSTGLMRSMNNGETWDRMDGKVGLSFSNSLGVNKDYVIALSNVGVSRANKSNLEWQLVNKENNNTVRQMKVGSKNILYYRYSRNKSDGGLLTSSTNGSQWSFKETSVDCASIIGDTIVYISKDKIYISEDFKKTWTDETLSDRYKDVTLSKSNIYLTKNDNQIEEYDYDFNKMKTIDFNEVGDYKNVIINESIVHNDSLYIATSNGLYIFDLISENIILISPMEDVIDFTTVNDYKDSVLLVGSNSGLYIKHKESDSWKMFDTSLHNLGYDFYNTQVIDNELYFFDPYTYHNKSIVIFRNGGGKWDSLLLDNYWRDGFGKIDDTYYYCDEDFVYYSNNVGKDWDTLQVPKSKTSEEIQRIYCATVFKNKLYIGASNGVYRYDSKYKKWDEIKRKDGFSLSYIDRFHQDKERLFVVATYSESWLNEYNKYEDLFENKMKQTPLGFSNFYNLLWNADNFIWNEWDSLFLTKDYGKTIMHINEKLLYNINGHYNLFDNYLYATTTEGLYKRSITDFGLTDVELTESSDLNLFAYPQPAKDELVIDIVDVSYGELTLADITIYDYTGSEIATKDNLTIETVNSGYSLTWDCSAEQAGVYIISITHGTEERAVKVVVE